MWEQRLSSLVPVEIRLREGPDGVRQDLLSAQLVKLVRLHLLKQLLEIGLAILQLTPLGPKI